MNLSQQVTGVITSYSDKLSYEERWQVIHYIRSLQAKSQGREYLVALTDQAAVKLSINGHTDNVGNPDSNRTLSQKRAQAVLDYLVGKGIDGGRLQAQGLGDAEPVADNATNEGRAQNRRTEVEIVQ